MAEQIAKSSLDLKREHWDNYNPVNARLSGIVEQVAEKLSNALDDTDDAPFGQNLDLLTHYCNTYTLPYGRIGMLPPTLFGDITKDGIAPTRPLVVPTDDNEIQKMTRSYEEWSLKIAQSGDYSYVSVPNSKILIAKMNELKGEKYPLDAWRASALVTQQVLNNEPIFAFDIHRVTRINSGGYDHDQLPPELQLLYRQRSSYVLALSQLAPEDGRMMSVRELVQMPVGEYGEQAAEKLARMVVWLGDLIRSSSVIDDSIAALDIDQDTDDLLRIHTMRTRESYERGDLNPIKNGLSDALIGGILSMTQAIAFLTAEKVPGYEDFDKLVTDILDSDVLELLARLAPVGYIGPITMAGTYIPGALDTSANKLGLSQEVSKHLGKMRREYFADMAAKWALYRSTHNAEDMPLTLGLTCPASEPGGAISTIRPLLKPFFVPQ